MYQDYIRNVFDIVRILHQEGSFLWLVGGSH
jgi:hypothetical protein